MKLTLLICFYLGLLGLPAFAQTTNAPTMDGGADTSPVPPVAPASLPPGPTMAKRAPDFAAWRVIYTYKDNSDQKLAPTPSTDPATAKAQQMDPMGLQTNPPKVRSEAFTKTGHVIHVTAEYARGLTGERWILNGIQLVKPRGSKGILAVTNTVMMGDLILDLSQTDFPGLQWVSASNYVGEKLIGGRKCYTFAKEGGRMQLTDPSTYRQLQNFHNFKVGPGAPVHVVAEIDEETGLPVMLKIGDDTRTYAFGSAPTAMLTLPDDYLAAWRAAEAPVTSLLKLRAPVPGSVAQPPGETGTPPNP